MSGVCTTASAVVSGSSDKITLVIIKKMSARGWVGGAGGNECR
jgi:hypothetical protein